MTAAAPASILAIVTGQAGLFPALLKHWRHRRGLSQLDLALAADVSSRHVSFLETGRSVPSAEMILRLSAALDVPLRQVNALLRAAGQDPVYPEPGPGRALTPDVARALEMLKNNQEPFPLVVIDRAYEVVDVNRGALRLFAGLMPGLTQEGVRGLNLLRATFAPGGVRDAIVNQDEVGRALLWRVQREVLADRDGPLSGVLEEVLTFPSVAEDWREVDLSAPASPTLVIHLRIDEREYRFVTLVTTFDAPQAVWLDELRIETWLPADERTAAACREVVIPD